MTYRGASLHLPGGHVVFSDDVAVPQGVDYGLNDDFLRVFVLSYLALLHDSPFDEKPLSVFLSFKRYLENHHLRDVISSFSSIADDLMRNHFVTGTEESIFPFDARFKKLPIFREYLTWYRTRNPQCYQYILTFLLFGKKIKYVDDSLDSTAFRGWEEVEERLSTLEFSSRDVSILRNVVSAILPPLSPDALMPRFGSGRVSERGVLHVHDKLSSLFVDAKLAYTFRGNAFGFTEHFDYRSHAVVNGCSTRTEHRSRLKFVPKDIKKSRSICMEPNGYMYFQQEVLRWVKAAMNRGMVSRFVNMDDQTNNQYAAVHGSKYQCSDTIDLSSASDSVHIDLVRGIFPPDYLYYLLGTRSSETIVPDGSTRRLYKFAPMGSALCFPIQCIIFTSVCIMGYMQTEFGDGDELEGLTPNDIRRFIKQRMHRRRSEDTPFSRRYEPPIVFGDDIVCDSRTTDAIVSILSRLGFSVNRSKSFTGSQSLRESCGVFAFEGSDVTPVLFRLPFFKSGEWDSQVFASLITNVNSMNANGYQSIGRFWLSILKGYGYKYPLPFVTDSDDFGIFTKNKHRVDPKFLKYNDDYQVYFERRLGIVPRDVPTKVPKNLEEYRYVQWWRSRIRGCTTPLSERSLRIRPQETRVAPIWSRCEQ